MDLENDWNLQLLDHFRSFYLDHQIKGWSSFYLLIISLPLIIFQGTTLSAQTAFKLHDSNILTIKSLLKNSILRSERTASKHVYYQVWNRSPVQVGCTRQVLRAGALGWPRGIGWGGRREGGSGWGTHVNPWLIHVSVWQTPLHYCKVISLQLIKTIEGKNGLSSIQSLSRVWLFATP